MLQLFSLPLEVLGVLLAMLEVFSPVRAERVTRKVVTTANDMRGFLSGVLVIITGGLLEAKRWQRVVVIGGIAAMLLYLAWRGNTDAFVLGGVIWVSVTLLITVTYVAVFLVFKLVRHFFPTRVLGIIGVLTASVGLLIESMQYWETLVEIDIGSGSGAVDYSSIALIVFYGAVLLCLISLVRIAFFQSQGHDAEEASSTPKSSGGL